VATNVPDHEAFVRCRGLGFTYFQGEYFAQPRLFRRQSVATARLGSLRRLAELTSGDVSFEDLEQIIASDIGLSLSSSATSTRPSSRCPGRSGRCARH